MYVYIDRGHQQHQSVRFKLSPLSLTHTHIYTQQGNNALAIGLGVGLSLLFLALLALLGFCCYRRRHNTNAVKPLGAQKLAEPTSKDEFVKAADAGKQCNYCQGPACMYGGQVEHGVWQGSLLYS